MNFEVNFYISSVFLVLISVNSYSQSDSGSAQKTNPKELAADVFNAYIPEFIDIGYAESKKGAGESWFINYDYESSKKWDPKSNYNESSGDYLYASGSVVFFAKGSYTFSDDTSPRDYSQVGGELKKIWIKVGTFSKKLTEDEKKILEPCRMDQSKEFKSVNDCRAEMGVPETVLSMLYFDWDAHLKVEGSKNFSERNYVYGAGVKFSAMSNNKWAYGLNIFEYPGRLLRKGSESYNMFPIFSFGVEQVDPKEDARRNDLVANKEKYDRVYGEIRHTSSLGKIKSGSVKLSLNYRYFEELDPPDAIKNADLDVSQYYTIAFQIPSSVLPTVTTSESEFIISYSEGELPFGRTDERVFEIGWRTNVEFGKIFAP